MDAKHLKRKTWKNVKNRTHNISKGNAPPMARLLLNMRDGPRGRAPDIGFALLSAATGVPVPHIVNPSVKPWLPSGMLCDSSVTSVVKEDYTIEDRKSTGQHRLPNKGRPHALHPGLSGFGGGTSDVRSN